MGMTAAAVNSALQRARATIAQSNLRSEELHEGDVQTDQQLLARYMEAFEQYDI